VGRKLKDVQELPAGEANVLLAGGMFEEEENEADLIQDA
jgi:hypothetical protein